MFASRKVPSSSSTQLLGLDCAPLFASAAHDQPAVARLAGALRALAHPVRQRILHVRQAQSSHEARLRHITDSFGLGQRRTGRTCVSNRAAGGGLDGLRAMLGREASEDRSLTVASDARPRLRVLVIHRAHHWDGAARSQ